jgi:predicted hotdog family 3-hydroxylacyl-ACP dehydratase
LRAVDVSGRDPATLVPHAGAMCLITRIVSADDRQIVCSTTTHRLPDNPLRRAGELASVHIAEYGAQVMAIHGGLLDPDARLRGGLLAGIRDLTLGVARLDDIAADIEIHAQRLVANAGGQIYSFVASAGGNEIARGRVSVMFAGQPDNPR